MSFQKTVCDKEIKLSIPLSRRVFMISCLFSLLVVTTHALHLASLWSNRLHHSESLIAISDMLHLIFGTSLLRHSEFQLLTHIKILYIDWFIDRQRTQLLKSKLIIVQAKQCTECTVSSCHVRFDLCKQLTWHERVKSWIHVFSSHEGQLCPYPVLEQTFSGSRARLKKFDFGVHYA